MPNNEANTAPPKGKKTRRFSALQIVLFVLCLCVVGASGFFIYQYFAPRGFSPEEYHQYTNPPAADEPPTGDPTEAADPLPENPINFPELQALNADVTGWIRVPNTAVDFPVLYPFSKDDNFYLRHDIYGAYDRLGAVYYQKKNRADFTDPVTVLYGHNNVIGGTFRSLYHFKDADFFANNRYMYLYTPGHILTYEIFAAYEYDDRHILYSFDFNNPAVLREYQAYILNPLTLIRNIREGVTLDADSKILTLSTCQDESGDTRYLVQGVLISDEATA